MRVSLSGGGRSLNSSRGLSRIWPSGGNSLACFASHRLARVRFGYMRRHKSFAAYAGRFVATGDCAKQVMFAELKA